MKTVFLDTGPLVALLDSRDQYHRWTQKVIVELEINFFITCEAVLVETLFVTKHSATVIDAMKGMIEAGLIKFTSILDSEAGTILGLLLKYQNLPASLTDGILVSLYSRTKNSVIFTTDSDFHIYKDLKGKPLSLISPYNR